MSAPADDVTVHQVTCQHCQHTAHIGTRLSALEWALSELGWSTTGIGLHTCPDCIPTPTEDTAPRDLAAEARTKAGAMRANFQPAAARLLDELADEIEAQRPRAIEDPTELGSLPVGSIVLTPTGVAAQKIRVRIGAVKAWFKPGAKPMLSAVDVLADGPVTLLHTGTEETPA